MKMWNDLEWTWNFSPILRVKAFSARRVGLKIPFSNVTEEGNGGGDKTAHVTEQAEPTEEFDGSLWSAERETIQRVSEKSLHVHMSNTRQPSRESRCWKTTCETDSWIQRVTQGLAEPDLSGRTLDFHPKLSIRNILYQIHFKRLVTMSYLTNDHWRFHRSALSADERHTNTDLTTKNWFTKKAFQLLP